MCIRDRCRIHPHRTVEKVCAEELCGRGGAAGVAARAASPLLCVDCLVEDRRHFNEHHGSIVSLEEFFGDAYRRLSALLRQKRLVPELDADVAALLAQKTANLRAMEDHLRRQKEELYAAVALVRSEVDRFLTEFKANVDRQLTEKLRKYEQTYDEFAEHAVELQARQRELLAASRSGFYESLQTEFERNPRYRLHPGTMYDDLVATVNRLKLREREHDADRLDIKFQESIAALKFATGRFSGFDTAEETPKLLAEIEGSFEEFGKRFEAAVQKSFRDVITRDKPLAEAGLLGGRPRREELAETAEGATRERTRLAFLGKVASCAALRASQRLPSVKLQKETIQKTDHTARVTCITMIDDDLVATGSRDHTIEVWSLRRGAKITTLHGHSDVVSSLARLRSLPSAEVLLSGGGFEDRSVILWEVREPIFTRLAMLREDSAHVEAITNILDLMDETHIVSADAKGTLVVWDFQARRSLFVLSQPHRSTITSLLLLEPLVKLASASYMDKRLVIWRLKYHEAEGARRTLLAVEVERAMELEYYPLTLLRSLEDPYALLVGDYDASVKVLDTRTWTVVSMLKGAKFSMADMLLVEEPRRRTTLAHDARRAPATHRYLVLGYTTNHNLRLWHSAIPSKELFIANDKELSCQEIAVKPLLEMRQLAPNQFRIVVASNHDTKGHFQFICYRLIVET
eukprot:TRINITY_DN1725_c0_g1_i2.p1 TRINITY_DN1725_c0_g1~~TRINITY_DN1725_c0_g1_i2.p1  ORF type:complete len:711 (+),score=151.80 TRINITY_DN1725_c0_g1_i2:64-2133(+)